MHCFESGDTLIYADNAATTKISDNALKQMLPFLQKQYGNQIGRASCRERVYDDV